jgi:hypothetical protein
MKNEQEIIYKDFFSAFAKNTSENTTSITIDVNKLHGNTRSHIRNSNRKAIPICFRPIYSSVDPIYKLFGDPSKVARLETIYANTTNIIDAYHAKKRKQHLVIISSVIAGVLGLSIIYLLKRHKLWIAQKIKTSSAKISGPLSDLLTLLGYGIVIPVSIAGTVLIIAVPTIGALKILEMIFKN